MKETSQKTMKRKRQLLHMLLIQTNQTAAKSMILDGYGVESTTELDEKQLDELIAWANGILNEKNELAKKEIRQWRSKCLRMMNLCGVDTQDWSKVNAFMLDKRISGKHLYELKTVEELQTLHRKLHNVAINKGKQIVKEQKQAFLN